MNGANLYQKQLAFGLLNVARASRLILLTEHFDLS